MSQAKKTKGRPKKTESDPGQDSDSAVALKRKVGDVAEEEVIKKRCCAEEQSLADVHVRIEHCVSWRVFKKRADELVTALKPVYPQLKFSFNPTKPRRGAFEFVLDKDGEEIVIWSGLKRGPPRREKFPDPDVLMELFKKYLTKD